MPFWSKLSACALVMLLSLEKKPKKTQVICEVTDVLTYCPFMPLQPQLNHHLSLPYRSFGEDILEQLLCCFSQLAAATGWCLWSTLEFHRFGSWGCRHERVKWRWCEGVKHGWCKHAKCRQWKYAKCGWCKCANAAKWSEWVLGWWRLLVADSLSCSDIFILDSSAVSHIHEKYRCTYRSKSKTPQ